MKSLTLLLLLVQFFVADGQNRIYFGAFPTIDHSGTFSDNWSYNSYNFVAIKPYNTAQDKARVLFLYTENGVSYSLSKRWTFTNSYVYERQEPFESIARNEHRLFQQITFQEALSVKAKTKMRIRFDERFIENIYTGEFNFSHRLRFLIGFSSDFSEKLYGFAYSEFFFRTSGAFKFNENWSALQLGYNLNERSSLEFGYLYVGWIYNQPNQWLQQHYLQTTWVNKLKLNNKRKNKSNENR